jgi:acyl-CoA synthetase (AMP-forming)/AMP-acid ligase II
MSMAAGESSIPAVLGERARQQPDARVFTFVDYEVDPAGYSQGLTWPQVHRRGAAISVPNDNIEQLAAIVELKKRGSSDGEILDRLRTVKREVSSVISKLHGLRLADLVLVPPGSVPITTSGNVRRSTCAGRYRQNEFTRLEIPA